MSIFENKEIVRRYYEEIVSTGEVNRASEFASVHYTEISEGERYEIGLEGLREHILGVRKTFQDLRISVEQQIAEGDYVVSLITATGIHKGEWLGIRPTGKEVVFTGVNVDKVVDGLIEEHGGAANMLLPLLELGALKVVG